MRPDLLDILAPPALGLVFLLLSWSQMHVTRGRHALTPYDRKLLIYGFFFVLGMGYQAHQQANDRQALCE